MLDLCYGSASSEITPETPFQQIYGPLNYAVIGQQKSGTSTLWNHMRQHPDIAWVGGTKEPLYFNGNGNYPRSMLCDNNLAEYHKMVGSMRLSKKRLDLRVGDWSATYFTCLCCPAVLKGINPDIKIILLLRDPIERALSRFQEQKSMPGFPLHQAVRSLSFAAYVDKELAAMEACLGRAALYRKPGVRVSFPVGWSKGMGLAAWMEAQCYERSNILGWSVYDLFLENYFAHVPEKQIMVLYTEDMAADPLTVVRKVESHLGLPPAEYNLTELGLVYNTHGCYAWKCAQQVHGEARSALESTGNMLQGGSARRRLRGTQPAVPEPVVDEQTRARLVAFYRPHMQRLFRWADERRISPVPASWREAYA